MKVRRRKKTALSRVRVPLPRQRGGPHEDKTNRPPRRSKHKKRTDADDD